MPAQKLGPDELSRIRQPVEDAWTLLPKGYTDPTIFAVEDTHTFAIWSAKDVRACSRNPSGSSTNFGVIALGLSKFGFVKEALPLESEESLHPVQRPTMK